LLIPAQSDRNVIYEKRPPTSLTQTLKANGSF